MRRSSTRSTRAPSRTPTATASATCAGSLQRLDHLELARRRRALALADLPLAGSGPRLRRLRPRLGRSAVRDARRLRRPDRGRARARPAGARRPRRLAHLDRAPLVPRASRPLRVVRRAARRTTGAPPSGARPGAATGRAAAGTCTPSTPSNPISTGETPRSARRWRSVVRFWRRARGRRLPRRRARAAMKDRELRDDPPGERARAASGSPGAGGARPAIHSKNDPEIELVLSTLREAAGEALLVGEVYLPAAALAPYLEHLDLVFSFDLLHCELGGGLARRRDRARGRARRAAPGRSPTTTSRGLRRASGRARPASRRCSC